MLLNLRMKDSGPNGNYTPGAVVEVDSQRAAILVKGGHAEEFETGVNSPPAVDLDKPTRPVRRQGR